MEDKIHFCYCLYNSENNKTYIGYTNNIPRRIRQHNGEIAGGAIYTTRQNVQWEYLFYVTSPAFDHKVALSFEWHLKHPSTKKHGPIGRIQSFLSTINHLKFNHINHYDFHIKSNFKYIIEEDDPRITIRELV
jgi:predicted GIY-YIG superfamily endonuclease